VSLFHNLGERLVSKIFDLKWDVVVLSFAGGYSHRCVACVGGFLVEILVLEIVDLVDAGAEGFLRLF